MAVRFFATVATAIVIVFNAGAIASDGESPDSGRGNPGRQSPTTARRCFFEPYELVAVAPISVVGQTASARPTLWLYIPEDGIQWAEFVLQDAELTTTYERRALDPQPGLNAIVPNFDLEPGVRYQWWFAFSCNPDPRTPPGYTRLWVERVERSDGILWYDELDRRIQRNQLTREWLDESDIPYFPVGADLYYHDPQSPTNTNGAQY